MKQLKVPVKMPRQNKAALPDDIDTVLISLRRALCDEKKELQKAQDAQIVKLLAAIQGE